jgi:hypothetical protein
MHPDPVVVQASISIPLALCFVLYSVSRRDRTPLHSLAAGLVFFLGLWITALVLRRIDGSGAIGDLSLRLEQLSSVVIAPVFVVTMGYFARHPAFVQGRAATLGFSAIFACLAAGFLSDDWHSTVACRPCRPLRAPKSTSSMDAPTPATCTPRSPGCTGTSPSTTTGRTTSGP